MLVSSEIYGLECTMLESGEMLKVRLAQYSEEKVLELKLLRGEKCSFWQGYLLASLLSAFQH